MKTPPNLSLRTSRPQSLGGAFGGLLRLFGRTASDADLAARWPEIIGADLAGAASLSGMSKGKSARTLTVRATNPAGALALSYRRDEIRTRVNNYFGYAAVEKVVIRK